MGIPKKSLWDVLELLIIHASLAGIAFFLQRSENRTDRQIGGERVQQETLNSYLDSMGTLIVNGDLNDERTVQVMRARTAAAIRVLETADHRNAVFGFLRDVDLLPVHYFREEDQSDEVRPADGEHRSADAFADNNELTIALLFEIDLHGANLRGADLRDADLGKADLTKADLTEADLSGASLKQADLTQADLTQADLWGADMTGAYLGGTDLTDAELSTADLMGAYLTDANLTGAYLRNANLTNTTGLTIEQLERASLLDGAKLPDGTVVETEEQWQEFKKQPSIVIKAERQVRPVKDYNALALIKTYSSRYSGRRAEP